MGCAAAVESVYMPDNVDQATRSNVMRQVHSKNTSPELATRRSLHAAGFRFRLHQKDLPGHPDIVLPRYRMAIFVQGCFWHWHGCKRSRMPADNREYWTRKIEGNVKRDQTNRVLIESMGWRCRLLWECQLAADITQLISDLCRERVDQARCGSDSSEAAEFSPVSSPGFSVGKGPPI